MPEASEDPVSLSLGSRFPPLLPTSTFEAVGGLFLTIPDPTSEPSSCFWG